jgi:hypothetical protein
MTRQPDIKNTTNRLVYVPTDQSENKLAMDVKALCIQDGITIRDFLSEAILLAFKVHHWPPGNPQLTLSNYQVKPSTLSHCGYNGCHNKAVGQGVYLPQNREVKLCKLHLDSARNTVNVWKF